MTTEKTSSAKKPSLKLVKSGMELPPRNTKRWVARRKAQVVYAVQAGAISLTDACERYSLSVEEFLGWQRAIENSGLAGLRTTRLKDYRNNENSQIEKTAQSV